MLTPQIRINIANQEITNQQKQIDNAKERFAIASSKRREEFSQAASQRRQSLRANLQREINAGNLGYADAAAIESDSQDQERDKKNEYNVSSSKCSRGQYLN